MTRDRKNRLATARGIADRLRSAFPSRRPSPTQLAAFVESTGLAFTLHAQDEPIAMEIYAASVAFSVPGEPDAALVFDWEAVMFEYYHRLPTAELAKTLVSLDRRARRLRAALAARQNE